MALSFVAASSAWVSSNGAVIPTAPAGLAEGDLVILVLVSKYETAVLSSDPVGWDGPGTPAVNTGRPTGNDNGNTRMRVFYRVWQSGDTMPSLAPNPNNVSTVLAKAYRSTTGRYDVVAIPLADDTTGTPLAVTTPALDLKVGDHLSTDMVLNGDVVTWGTTTVTASGITFGTATSAPADANTTTGTDLRMRAMTRAVTAGTGSPTVTVSTALAGTTTNAVGTVAVVRVREDITPIASFSASSTDIRVGEVVTFTDTSLSNPTSWAWDFGAGASPATASTQGPHAVTYSTTGDKTVTMTATNAGGSDAADPLNVLVRPALIVSVWNGTAWKIGGKVWNGTSWRTDAKIWNGTQWVPFQ